MVHRPLKPLTLTLSQREGGTLNCAPSADAVAGNGRPLSWAPSADAVAGGDRMDFVAVVDQVIALLRQRGRVTYRTLQLQFQLDDAQLATLKDELLYSQPHVVDDAGRGLLWTGARERPVDIPPSEPSVPSASPPGQPTLSALPPAERTASDAERRQLTVMFCDLVDSTHLSS